MWVDPLGLSPSSELAAAMALVGRMVPSGYAAHHLLPTSITKNSALIKEAIKRGIYDPNGASNGVGLPMKVAESLSTGKPLHSGRHLKEYFSMAERTLQLAETKLGNLSDATDAQILSKINASERLMKLGLNSDRYRLQSTDQRPQGTRSKC